MPLFLFIVIFMPLYSTFIRCRAIEVASQLHRNNLTGVPRTELGPALHQSDALPANVVDQQNFDADLDPDFYLMLIRILIPLFA
jgi:hypothetical protein